MTAFYELQLPTTWAEPPSRWSSTSLDEALGCARRWQLLRSRWGEHERFPVRQHPTAIEGQIIHDALDRLSRACGARGNPPFATSEFAECITEIDFFGGFDAAVADCSRRAASHPRPGPLFTLRSSAQELANRAIRLYREQYVPGAFRGEPQRSERLNASTGTVNLGDALRRRLARSEVELSHPGLPFMGVLDRVALREGNVEIVDYKTGQESPKHEEQLRRYAVLWWRATGVAPARIVVQYLGAARAWSLDIASLSAAEVALRHQIETATAALAARPAKASPSANCATCAVRARCDEGWEAARGAAPDEGGRDVGVVTEGGPGPHGFLARDPKGKQVAVVHSAAVASLVPTFAAGASLRILNALAREKGSEIEIKPWTEVFVVKERARDDHP